MVDVKKLFYRIFIVIAVVILSIPLWNNSPSKVGADIASSFKDSKIAIDFEGFDSLSNIDSSDYEIIEPKTVTLRNITGHEKDFNIVYVYAKTSTVSYKNLMLSLDNHVYSLNDIKYTEDSLYYYFVLSSDSLDAYTSKNIEARIWTDALEGSLTGSIVVM